jgi:proline iminopeptidase
MPAYRPSFYLLRLLGRRPNGSETIRGVTVGIFPEIEPFESGMLDVGDSQQIYWECSGNPSGRTVVYLHGGPGSGCTAPSRRYFDPRVYKIVLTDQRGCGRSRPLVETIDHLAVNTTDHLVSDLERLREHLHVERWALLGASWGSTLALAYAQRHPRRVTAIVLACVTTTSRREVHWITHGVGRIFPEQWERFAALRSNDGGQATDLVDTYGDLVFDADPSMRERAAREWCAWEDTHVSLSPGYRANRRFDDPAFRLLFTRLVTHYWRHSAFLEEGRLLRNASLLKGVPGVLVHGRYDISSPLEIAWQLHRSWPNSKLHVVESGHGGGAMTHCVVRAFSM